MRISKKGYITTFIDMVTIIAMTFMCFFIIMLLIIASKKEDTKKKKINVEYIITVEWDYERNVDVDSYLMDPLKHIVMYRRREDGFMNLDRDDRGSYGDTVVLPNGKVIEYKENREIITIRGIVKGRYILNVHMFSMHNETKPVSVRVKIEKVNPYLRTVYTKTVTLFKFGDEKTILIFNLDKKGNIVKMDDSTFIPIATNPRLFQPNLAEDQNQGIMP